MCGCGEKKKKKEMLLRRKAASSPPSPSSPPALLSPSTPSMLLFIVGGLFFIGLLSFLASRLFPRPCPYKGKTVALTGGSSGLGAAIVDAALAAGAERVIVFGRRPSPPELDHVRSHDRFTYVANVDVTDPECSKVMAEHVDLATVDTVVTCAGASLPGKVATTPTDEGMWQMRLNYGGTINVVEPCVRAWLPLPAADRARKQIVLVSSACGLLGLVGYARYCASKFALKGYADCLRSELSASGIRVSIFLPGSIDTPGFEEENKRKPIETATIEGTANLQSAAECAKSLYDGLRRGEYAITTEALLEIARMGANGLAPRTNTAWELLLIPLIVIVDQGFHRYADFVVASFSSVPSAATKADTKDSSKKQK